VTALIACSLAGSYSTQRGKEITKVTERKRERKRALVGGADFGV
jgi:hypothetical protein